MSRNRPENSTTTTSNGEAALRLARRRDVESRRARVRHALQTLQANDDAITLSSVARAASVHRSFLHRHSDLRAEVIAASEAPSTARTTRSGPSRRSLEASNFNLRETNQRLRHHIDDLEERLSELLGEQAHARTGLGSDTSRSQLENQITHLEQQVADLRCSLSDRDDEVAATRSTMRKLMTELNER